MILVRVRDKRGWHFAVIVDGGFDIPKGGTATVETEFWLSRLTCNGT